MSPFEEIEYLFFIDISFYGNVIEFFDWKSCESLFHFTVYPCNVKIIEFNLQIVRCHFFSYIATTKLLQTWRLFQMFFGTLHTENAFPESQGQSYL